MIDPKKTPVALVILDGWEISESTDFHRLTAHTPIYDQVRNQFPSAALAASSDPETGHLAIGTGRNVTSDANRIEKTVKKGDLAANATLRSSFTQVASKASALHLIGLISSSNDESSHETLSALLSAAKQYNIETVYIHCILDGRHSVAGSAPREIAKLKTTIKEAGLGSIATVCGRFYAMDTGGNWERTARVFTMLVHGDGDVVSEPESAVRNALARGISEEFLAPMVVVESGTVRPAIRTGDTVLFFNHKPDGLKQLARSVATSEHELNIQVLCLTDYEINFDTSIVFPKDEQCNVLSQVTTSVGISTCRITESERSSHITNLFDGGVHRFKNGDREFNIPSTSVRKFTIRPESGSFRIADCARRELRSGGGLFILNLPAAALAAKWGDAGSMVEAVQYVDTCLGGILEPLLDADGTAIITSSHGSKVASLVPFHLIGNRVKKVQIRESGTLQDIAPTLLGLMGLDPPTEMAGTDLRII